MQNAKWLCMNCALAHEHVARKMRTNVLLLASIDSIFFVDDKRIVVRLTSFKIRSRRNIGNFNVFR